MPYFHTYFATKQLTILQVMTRKVFELLTGIANKYCDYGRHFVCVRVTLSCCYSLKHRPGVCRFVRCCLQSVRGVINDFRTFHSNLYKVGHVFFTEGASLIFSLYLFCLLS